MQLLNQFTVLRLVQGYLVTTKQGRKGDLRVEYIGSIGISTRPQAKFNMMSTAQITQIQKDLGFIDQATYDARNRINTNWDDIFLRTGITMSNDLSVSGGGGNTTFKISLGHLIRKELLLIRACKGLPVI